MRLFVIMGVSGAGKSTVGVEAARAIDIPLFEGDNYHSDLAKAKMESGVALDAVDRQQWIDRIITEIKAAPPSEALLTCSALSRKVRRKLRAAFNGNVVFFHLHGEVHILKRRLKGRKDHFFNPALLASQFAALEMPARAIELNIANPVSIQVDIIAAEVTKHRV